MRLDTVIRAVQASLTPDLLKREYREGNRGNPMFGHCYVATEALYYMLREGGLEVYPMHGKDPNGIVHWWLEDDAGNIIDATADQYFSVGEEPPYERGTRGAFLPSRYRTGGPSERARVVIERVLERKR